MPFNPRSSLPGHRTLLSLPLHHDVLREPRRLGIRLGEGKETEDCQWAQSPLTSNHSLRRWTIRHQGHFRWPGSSRAPRPTAPPMGIGYISAPLLPLWHPSPETACTFFSSSYLFPNMLSLKLRAPLHLGLLRSFSQALLSFM